MHLEELLEVVCFKFFTSKNIHLNSTQTHRCMHTHAHTHTRTHTHTHTHKYLWEDDKPLTLISQIRRLRFRKKKKTFQGHTNTFPQNKSHGKTAGTR